MRTYRYIGAIPGDLAGRGMPGASSPFLEGVIIPASQAALVATAAGAAVGCTVWLTVLDSAAIPAGLAIGCAVFVVVFPTFLARNTGEYTPSQGKNDLETPTNDPTDDPAPSGVVILNGRAASHVTPAAQARSQAVGRFADFVRACAVSTERRRLEALGYGRVEIHYYRTKLLQANMARWNGPNARAGWSLTASPAAILGGLDWEGWEGNAQRNGAETAAGEGEQ